MIKLEQVKKIYKSTDKSTLALDDVSLTFKKTGFVSILGPSGCGKTSLLNIIGGLDRLTAGTMYFAGKDVAKFHGRDWDDYRKNSVGFVFQSYNLIPALNIEENLILALAAKGVKKKQIKEEIKNSLERFSLYDQRKKNPHQLSSGQQQRVGIIRALLKSPKIILADEPTGALDSKTALEVMEVLKEASKTCLVIVVTHNEKLANTYADRIINLLDGKVIIDSDLSKENEITKKPELNSPKFKFLSMFILTWRHLTQKLIRSLLIILANSIGVIGVCLVLTISSGVKKYIIDIQKETLANSPITIRSTADNTNPNIEVEDLELYPTDEVIHIVSRYEAYYNHINIFSEDFLEHLNELDSSLYNIIDYKTVLDMKILSNTHNQLRKVSTYKFMMIGEEDEYLSSQYDCLYGSLPKGKGELAILVDKYNSIDVSVLNYLGIDYEGLNSYTFAQITNKEYKVILNDQYYYERPDGAYTYYNSSQYPTLYQNEENITLKITGILRLNKDAKTNIYESGILYTKALRDFLITDANSSNIGQAQLAWGMDKNVFTGQSFVDTISINGTVTKEYQYEGQLADLGLIDEISTIRVYTDNFEARVAINEYFKAYNENVPFEERILYYDYMGDFSREFDAFIEILTKTLMIFALIALFVSSIMIGIITYISVMEKIREIGILRSLGYEKGFVRRLFNTQNGLIGCLAGLIGIFSGSFLMKPIVQMIITIMENNSITTFNISHLSFSSFGIGYFAILILANMSLAVIAGSIPASRASRLKPVDAINKE